MRRNLLILLALILFSVPKADPMLLKPMFPRGIEGVGSAIAIIYVSFFGYQLIANNAEKKTFGLFHLAVCMYFA